MLCKMLSHANAVGLRNLFLTSAVMCLAMFVPACTKAPATNASGIELREVEHKTIKHPVKDYFANIWPYGLQVSFNTAQGHFGTYEFPHNEFPLGEPTFLSCPGSPDFLPMRVVRLNEANDYKIEWLAKSPATSEGARKVVRSH
jgi:hypothetical protein